MEALQRVLADRLRVLGPDHRHTLSTSSNLAYWRGRAGDPAGAVEALRRSWRTTCASWARTTRTP
ncbi:tetratricopeptide repeat protein [Micromonospora echinospora]|uniref:tetratricopeptide repeat protein n=1 Tax=Micromonospora echinospora TaxID=1877 RepID=UPI003A869612